MSVTICQRFQGNSPHEEFLESCTDNHKAKSRGLVLVFLFFFFSGTPEKSCSSIPECSLLGKENLTDKAKERAKAVLSQDFPGGPVVKTLSSNARACEFDPWLGSYDPTCLTVKKPKHKTKAIW